MAVYKENIVDIDLAKGSLHRSFLTHTIGSGDVEADHFGVRVFRDGEPVDLTDVSVQGIFNPPQGSPIALTSGNVISGNVAAVVLKQACYNYNGQFCLSIKLVGGGVTGTMRIVDGVVDNTHSTGTVAPTEEVPTYQEVIAQYDAMVAATAAANGAIAKPYAQLTFPVKKGEYTIVDGALKRALVDIATSETYTAAHWTDAKLGPDLSQLKSAFDANQNDTADAYGVNFFNPYALIRNTHLFSDGIPVASDNYDCTDFIDVGSATKFTFKLFEYSGTCSFLVYQYKSDKTFIKRTSNSSYITGRTFNLESNTKYIRISVDHTSSGTINPYKVMCVWGEATLSEFVPYFTAYDRTARADAQTRALLSGTVYNFNRTDVPSDCDSVTTNSIHYIQTGDTIAHFPFAGTHQAGWLITVVRSSNNILQVAIEAAYGDGLYIRTKNSGTWLSWRFVPWIAASAIADVYDPEQTYDIGEFVIHNGQFCFCKVYISTPEAWNADHWQTIPIMDFVKTMRDDVCNTSSLAMFTKVGCIGDSFTAGYLYNKNNVEPDYVPDGSYPAISYPAVMGRIYGIETQNWGKAGATTASWITDKLPEVLAADPQQLYIIALGLNDNTQSVPIADAIANVKTIVDSILVHAPSAKFVIVKSLWVLRAGDHATYPYGVTGYYTYISQLAEAISEYYGFPYIETMGDPFFCGKAYVDGLHGFHPTAPLYAGMAKRLGQLLDKCIIDNPDYFFNFYIPND